MVLCSFTLGSLPRQRWWAEVLIHAGKSIWAPLLGFLLFWGVGLGVLAYHWRLFARALYRGTRNVCPRCGYSLKGIRSGVCPECGERVGIDPRFKE